MSDLDPADFPARTIVYVDAGFVRLAVATPDGDTIEVRLPVESARNLASGLVVAADEVEGTSPRRRRRRR
jgi:hypothetical protein